MKRHARKTNTDIRQEQISRAALRLIGRRGLRRLNVARPAREVGVAPSPIYRHLRSKDEVLEAVLGAIAHRFAENVELVRRGTPEAIERLRQLQTKESK